MYRKIWDIKFILLVAMLCIMLGNYYIFSSYTVFDIGTNWRLVDVFVVGLLLLVIPRLLLKFSLRIKSGLFGLKLPFYLKFFNWGYALIVIIAIIRGFIASGSPAFVLGRHYLLGLFLLLVIPEVIDTFIRLRKVVLLIIALIVPIWTVNLIFQTTEFSSSQILQKFLDANTVMSLAVAFLFALGYYLFLRKQNEFQNKTYLNRYLPFIVVFGLIMIMYARHRSVWVGTAGGLLVIAIFSLKGKRFFRRIVTYVFLISAALVIFLFGMKHFSPDIIDFLLYDRLSFLTRGVEYDPSGNWRYLSWLKALAYIFSTEPLVGLGFNFNRFYFEKTIIGYVPIHNDYIMFFQATGFIGLFFYIGMLVSYIFYGISKLRKIKNQFLLTVQISALSSLIANSVYMIFYMQNIILWFVLAILHLVPRLDTLIVDNRRFKNILNKAGARSIVGK